MKRNSLKFNSSVKNFQPFVDSPTKFELEKSKIATETLKTIDDIFTKAKAQIKADHETHEAVKRVIDESSKAISETMISNIKMLANLMDVEFLGVLSKVFGDENVETNENVKLILKEATEIYDIGESVFKYFEEINKKMEN